jgi:D-alanine-D-alanine ligase
MKIAVLCGGISPERNVSLNSGKAVAKALMELGHEVTLHDPANGAQCRLDIDSMIIPNTPPTDAELASFSPKKLIECVASGCMDSVDIAFSVLHGKYGEDGIMQALLQARGIPYTGSEVMASALAMDKLHSKIMFNAAGVPTPPWAVVRADDELNETLLKELRSEFPNGIVVKPNDQGSTVGMSIITNGNLDDLENAIVLALQYSDVVLLESYIEGRELTVAVLGSEALPLIEIAPDGGFYDYEHKYTKGMSQYICPAELDEGVTDFIQNLAVTAHKVLGCRGYSRVDFRLDEDYQPWCLEVNTLPGMTETSLVPKAAQADDISFAELCERIIKLSLPKSVE